MANWGDSQVKELLTVKSTPVLFRKSECFWKIRRHTDAVVITHLEIWNVSAGSLWVMTYRHSSVPILLVQCVRQLIEGPSLWPWCGTSMCKQLWCVRDLWHSWMLPHCVCALLPAPANSLTPHTLTVLVTLIFLSSPIPQGKHFILLCKWCTCW